MKVWVHVWEDEGELQCDVYGTKPDVEWDEDRHLVEREVIGSDDEQAWEHGLTPEVH